MTHALIIILHQIIVVTNLCFSPIEVPTSAALAAAAVATADLFPLFLNKHFLSIPLSGLSKFWDLLSKPLKSGLTQMTSGDQAVRQGQARTEGYKTL